MSINIKKYTKDQMAKMVEDAQTEVQELKRVSQLNGEAITRENVIANLKADNDILLGKLKDTETALGKSANEASRLVSDLQAARMQVLDLGTEVDVARNHPWRNLWAWFKREAARHE
jgi:hypothetical protein